MKAILYKMFLVLIGPTLICFSQGGTQGIFLNADDFRAQKLTHASVHTHIKLHEVFKKKIVEVKVRDSSYIYKKASIFGYRDKEGISCRFFNDEIFPILNPNETILIYRLDTAIPSKGLTKTYSYYFSADATRAVFPLLIANLEKEFKGNKAFLNLLEVHFSNSSDLSEYDPVHKMYKLNRLLELAENEK